MTMFILTQFLKNYTTQVSDNITSSYQLGLES